VRSVKIAILLLATAVPAMAGFVKTTFYGEVSDTQCALNVHSLSRSHEEMIEKNTMGTDAPSGAKAGVRPGSGGVLGDSSRNTESLEVPRDWAEVLQTSWARIV